MTLALVPHGEFNLQRITAEVPPSLTSPMTTFPFSSGLRGVDSYDISQKSLLCQKSGELASYILMLLNKWLFVRLDKQVTGKSCVIRIEP